MQVTFQRIIPSLKENSGFVTPQCRQGSLDQMVGFRLQKIIPHLSGASAEKQMYIHIPCRSTPVFKTVLTKRLFYSANDCFPYPAASTPAIFFKNVCYVQLWPWFGSVKAASTCPRGSCLYFMRNWFKNESSAVNGAWIRVKAEWKEVLSRERRF